MKALLFAAALVALPTSAAFACGGQDGKVAQSKPAKADTDIVETAAAAGSFSILVKAVQAAGLVDTLKGDGPFTVFAPTDEAFAKLPKGTLDKLLKDKKALANVLTYHVVPGRVTAKKAARLSAAKTVQGSNIRISTASGVRINDASVVKADINTRNGVIHAIDTVLIPKS